MLTPGLVAIDEGRGKGGQDMRTLRRAAAIAVDLALPPRCPGCGAVTRAPHRFCPDCWQALHFLGPPWCAGCQAPFAYDRGEGALCGDCLARPPRHSGIFAAVAYGDIARNVALKLKYGGRMALARTMAGPMVRRFPANADLIVPVPLHRRRLRSRGFNQAALIAAAIGRETGVPSDPFLLERQRATPVLRGLGARQRIAAVSGAFSVPDRRKPALRGKRLVLVDDVHTSGATAAACTAALLAAGAASVAIQCWARVLDGESD